MQDTFVAPVAPSTSRASAPFSASLEHDCARNRPFSNRYPDFFGGSTRCAMDSAPRTSPGNALQVAGQAESDELAWDEEGMLHTMFPRPRKRPFFSAKMWTVLGVVALVGLLVAATVVVFTSGKSEQNKPEETFRVLVVGDFGRGGGYNQSETAEAMAAWARTQGPVSVVINTGDNFYEDGLRHGQDPMFDWSFSHVYHQKELQIPFLGVLGNHDYHGNVTAQTSGELSQRDPRFIVYTSGMSDVYQVPPNKTLQFFFLDTSPFIEQYRKDPCKSCTAEGTCDGQHWEGCRVYDWKELGGYSQQDNGADEAWEEMLRSKINELQTNLRNSDVDWKVVVGHHPVRGQGGHGNAEELLQMGLEDVLEEEGVRLYLNGHDHNLQHLRLEGSDVNFCCSGAGSMIDVEEKHPYSEDPEAPRLSQDFFSGTPGFLYLSFVGDVAHGHFLQSLPALEDLHHFHATLG